MTEDELGALKAERVSRSVASEDPDYLGKIARAAWIELAKEHPEVQPSWLQPWESLPQAARDAYRRITASVAVALEAEHEALIHRLGPTAIKALLEDPDCTKVAVVQIDELRPLGVNKSVWLDMVEEIRLDKPEVTTDG